MLLLKRRDGVCIETEPAFPQAGSVKDLYKQRTESSTEKEMWENLKCSFSNCCYVYGYLCLPDNALVLRPRWGQQKSKKRLCTKHEDLEEKIKISLRSSLACLTKETS